MRLVEKTDQHEMLRLWAISEVHVEFLNAVHEDRPKHLLKLLNSRNLVLEEKGINQILKDQHLRLIKFIPADVIWYKAWLDINKIEFNRLNTLPVSDLARITNNTHRVAYGANIVPKHPFLNSRINRIIKQLEYDKSEVQFSGITLLAKNVNGPYTIIEGNGRLISLYHLQIIKQVKLIPDEQLAVVLGISPSGIV